MKKCLIIYCLLLFICLSGLSVSAQTFEKETNSLLNAELAEVTSDQLDAIFADYEDGQIVFSTNDIAGEAFSNCSGLFVITPVSGDNNQISIEFNIDILYINIDSVGTIEDINFEGLLGNLL